MICWTIWSSWAPGLVLFFLQVRDFFRQDVQAVFLGIQLMSIALQESFLFGAAFQRFHVFAQPRLIFSDGFDFMLPSFDLRSQTVYLIFLVEDAMKGFLHGGRDLSLLGDEGYLILVEIGQGEFAALGMVFLYVEIRSLARWHRYAEAQIRNRSFLRLWAFDQFPVFTRGMLDDNLARDRVGIVQSEFAAVALLAAKIHQPFYNMDVSDRFLV